MKAASQKQLAGALLKAAIAGDTLRVRELFASGAKPDQRVTGEPTPLIAAVTRGHIDVVRALLHGGANPSFKHGGKGGTTALLEAIRHDQFQTGCELVAAGADVHHDWSGEGQNITYEAIKKCNECYRTAFPRKGPNLLGLTFKGEGKKAGKKSTGLYPESLKLAEMILEAGGKPGKPCLPASAGAGNLAVVRLLLAQGVDVNEKDNYNGTAFSDAIAQCQDEVAVELLKAGANPNAGETISGPPLHAAVVAGKADLVKTAIACRCDLNFRATVTLDEPVEKTTSSKKEQPRYVLNLGEDYIDFAKAYDSTPLIVAVRAGHAEIVRLLANGGADLEAMDRDGFTALAWALKRERGDLAKMLRSAGAKESSSLEGSPLHVLFEACASGDAEKARTAIANGADINGSKESTREHVTPLMVAASEGHLDVVAALLKAGANPNLGGREELLMIVSPLLLAARHGHVEVVKQLLDAGAGAELPGRDLIQLRKEGDGAIHEAARNGHSQIVQLLLSAGVKPTARSAWSDNVLSAAVESGNLQTVQVVLAAGAKVTSRNRTGLLAEAMAAKRHDIVKELHAAYAVATEPMKGAK